MTWEEIREQFPNQWVLFEAFGAYTENGYRVYPKIIWMGAASEDFKDIWAQYKRIKEVAPERELVFYHTNNEQLLVGVVDAFGRKLPHVSETAAQ